MANRSYLYATNAVPGTRPARGSRWQTGIAECRYGIPIVFKLLASANPRACPSSIWEQEGDIALAGDYDGGVARLGAFLARIDLPEVQPLIAEARTFLHARRHRGRWFLLECGEMYALEEQPLRRQNQTLLAELQDLEPQIDWALESLSPTRRRRKSEPDLAESIDMLGLGRWSKTLYFNFARKGK